MSEKIVYPATERNQAPILEVLQKHIPPNTTGKLLEIASGTGQHVAFFSKNFPNLTFQPSEFEKSLLGSISAYIKDASTKNILPPVEIDICSPPQTWPVYGEQFDYVLNVNMFHISPYECSTSFFKNCSQILKKDALIFTYGPYAVNGRLEPASNVDFDLSLKSRNPEWGIRDLNELEKVAERYQIKLDKIYDMPANNKTLIWRNCANV